MPLCLALSATAIAQSLLFVMVPVIGESTGISFADLAVAISLGIAAFILAAPLWGRLSDGWGRRRVMLCGSAGSLIGHGGLALSIELASRDMVSADQCFYLLTAFRVIYGLSAAAVFPVAQAWVAERYGDMEMMSKFGALRMALTLGRFAGPPAAAALLLLAPLAPIHFVTLFALLALIAVWLTQDSPAQRPWPAARQEESSARDFQDSAFVPLLLIVVLLSIGLGQLQFSIGLHAQVRFGYTASTASQFVGLLLTAAAVAALAMQVLVIKRLQPHAVAALSVAAAVFSGAIALAFWGEARWLFLMSAILAGATIAIALPACAALTAAGRKGSGMGGSMGAFGSAQTLGYALGAALGGLYTSVPAVSFGLAIAAPLLAVALILVSPGLRRRGASLKVDTLAGDNVDLRKIR